MLKEYFNSTKLDTIVFNKKEIDRLEIIGLPFIGVITNKKCYNCIASYYMQLVLAARKKEMENSKYKFKDKKMSYRLAGNGKTYNHLSSTEEELAYLYGVRPELFEEIEEEMEQEQAEEQEGETIRKKIKRK